MGDEFINYFFHRSQLRSAENDHISRLNKWDDPTNTSGTLWLPPDDSIPGRFGHFVPVFGHIGYASLVPADPQDPVPTPGPDPTQKPVDQCRSKNWGQLLQDFNHALADANTGLKVDNEGNLVNSDRRSLAVILSHLTHSGWQQFSTNINPLHQGGIHLEGQVPRTFRSSYSKGLWYHMVFYPAQKDVLGPRQTVKKVDDLSKPPVGFEMHCERGGLQPSSIAHGLDYLRDILLESWIRLP